MKLIFSADNSWGIGRDNKLLFHTKGDMARFREITAGKVVIMGRATLESLPGSKPLPNRVNIVLTTDTGFSAGGAIICHSLGELFETVQNYPDGDLFVIGGEKLYRGLLDYCDTAYVTRFFADAPADRFMPDFDRLDGWKLVERSKELEEDGIRYRFDTYAQDNAKGYK